MSPSLIFLGRDGDSVHGHPELPIQLLRVQCDCLEMTQTYYRGDLQRMVFKREASDGALQ